ncbi:MAG: hypothetical protein HYT87_03335 [Nitrospirae bacterium]|nr:hypothetical protein [Nitrospirota bacterium]
MDKLELALILSLIAAFIRPVYAAEAEEESEPVVEGTMLGGEVILSPAGATLGPSFQYWGENIGLRLGLAMSLLRGNFEIGDTSADADQTATSFGGDVLLGLPSSRSKPYVSIGVQRSSTEQEQNDGKSTTSAELSSTELNVGLGVDFAAAENAVIGVGLMRFGYVLSGSLKSGSDKADLSGYALGLLSSFSVRYVF